MRNAFKVIAVCGLFVGSIFAQQPANSTPNTVVRVATALNHLTVLEFHEPVTMAAAGSPEFQIERESNKVFIKPTKSGAQTDLFVWTASRRFTYELETTEEVKNMNFAIDTSPAAVPKPLGSAPSDEIADIVLTRALLGAEGIHQPRARPAKNAVNVLVVQVFRTRTTVYVQYKVENNTKHTYHLNPPRVSELEIDDSSLPTGTLVHNQLDRSSVEKLGNAEAIPLVVAHSETESPNLEPGEATQGVVAIRRELKSPTVVQLAFEEGVKATVVL